MDGRQGDRWCYGSFSFVRWSSNEMVRSRTKGLLRSVLTPAGVDARQGSRELVEYRAMAQPHSLKTNLCHVLAELDFLEPTFPWGAQILVNIK